MEYQIGTHIPDTQAATWVADSAAVVGRVTLGPRVGVFYGAVLRGDSGAITVGAGSNLQDCCVVHADPDLDVTIGNSVTVGHGAVLHGCTVGDHVLVGMGAVVLNGAVIGEGSLIAAKALVPESVEIPPNSLVAGIPAKVRRELTPDERQGMLDNVRRYEQLAVLHASATRITGTS